jgi:uncharacterized protein
MLYRQLGKTGLTVSALGFGAMRLPLVGGYRNPGDGFDPTKIVDEDEAIRMVDYAVSHGVNYFDTAYVYHHGKSEIILGKALKGHRDKVTLVTKSPVMMITKTDDFERFLDEQLKRLDTGYLDVYLLHGLDGRKWKMVRELGFAKFLDRIQADGRVRYVGFSFHDDVAVFKEILDGYDWKVCQIQYNYYDEQNQAGKEGLAYAASRGIGVVIMEPIRGGKLAGEVPKEVQALWDSARTKRTPAEWALRWVWNHPEVSTVLSGMSTMDQLVENVRVAEDGKPDSLSPEEISLISQVKGAYRTMFKVDCTACNYCLPCESGVNIPLNFAIYNDMGVFKDAFGAAFAYNMGMAPEQRAENCTECGTCEDKCPQHIPIKDELKKFRESLPQFVPPPFRRE